MRSWNNTRGLFVCRYELLWRGPWNNTRGRSLCLQVGVVVGAALEQHTGPQSLFAGGGCCGEEVSGQLADIIS